MDVPDHEPRPSSLELLGLPADARVLIVNNDDFGMDEAINDAVIASIEEGVAASCSLMPPCPGASHAMDLIRRREIPFGIHLTLVRDAGHCRWGPLTAKEHVPSLLDEEGELFTPPRIPDLLAGARLDEVEREFRAQVGAVLDSGLTPTHLDWHCLADGGRDDIFDLTVALADEYGLAVRAWLAPGREKLRRRALPVVDHDFLDSFSLVLDGKAERYAELLRALPSGLSEWATHPSTGDSGAIDDGRRVRTTDYDFLTSPQARDIIREEGITVIGYEPLQRAWLRPADHHR
ncbi:polysaccharide deacetylase family protein [Nonomuraea dietziae]|uniref:polysaccharide deacetylase family protein n=1 Tax=Nonomuraea dietziae TaxID=65515 RepID=UPI0034176E24